MRKIKFLLFLLLISVSVNVSFAQEGSLSSKSKKAIKFYKQAETSMRQQDYAEAGINLEKALKKDQNFKEAMLLIGDVYREQYKFSEAINIYERLNNLDSTFYPSVYYFLGDLYLENEFYDKSINAFKKYLKKEGDNPERAMLAEFGYEKAVFAKHASENPVDVNIKRLNDLVNSKNEEYINYVNEDESKMIFTRKDYGKLGLASSYFREYFMESNKNGDNWGKPSEMKLSGIEGNIGGMSLSFDGKQMFFTACNWPSTHGGCDIYFSEFDGTKWSKAKAMQGNINSNSWDSQASISADGGTLYFSSRRKGGKGGSDIWKSIKLDNGEWSRAISLGDSINTAGDEMAPYIHPDGQTLYFSSNGRIGMGGFDVYVSKKDLTGQWTKGENLSYPINTKYDEINIFLALNGEKAWISSKRNEDSFIDIFSLKLNEESKPEEIIVLKGVVLDNETNKPLKAKIVITDLENAKVFSISESQVDDGSFMSVLFPDREYSISISRSAYFFYSGHLNFSNQDEIKEYTCEFKLNRIKEGASANLQNIYFDINKWELKNESFPELKKLVELLNDNSDLQINIQGHTDNTGNEKHNIELSEKRAKSVMDYLINSDISAKRLSFTGLGSSLPIADNSTSQGRLLNRRTTIAVK